VSFHVNSNKGRARSPRQPTLAHGLAEIPARG
jgi:hypothetical protein